MEMRPGNRDLEKIQVKRNYKVGASNMLQIAILIFEIRIRNFRKCAIMVNI